MKRIIILAAAVICVLIGLAGCNEQNQSVQVDAPQLASSLRWVGVCAVLCSTIGGVCLVLASRNRRK
jgi:hypothetical protein